MKKSIFLLWVLFSFFAKAQFITNTGIPLTNTTQIMANGDWVNNGLLVNNGVIRLTDNWTDINTYSSLSTGAIVLSYESTKTFNHNGQSVHTLIKQGAGQAAIHNGLIITDTLRLNGGLLIPTGSLSLAQQAVVNVANSSSYIFGALTHLGSGDKFFPIGNASHFLPLIINKITGTSPSVTAVVENFPQNQIAGAGINSFVNFPIAWRVVTGTQTDTASYIEFGFPKNIVANTDALVAIRAINPNIFEGMGKRSVFLDGETVRLTSYSRALRGLFSIATGFAGNLETDSLALVALYNATNGAGWTKKTNWLSGRLNTWQGITQTGGGITAIALDNAQIKGAAPDQLADIQGLQTINLSSNSITKIPDLSKLPSLTSLNVSNNNLDFGSLEFYAGTTGVINYANQKPIVVIPSDTTLVPVGNNYSIKTQVGGTQNNYNWKKNNVLIPEAAGASYSLTALDRTNMGTYQAGITNTLVPGLTLTTVPATILAVADISGKVQTANQAPIINGNVTLLRITTSGSYDTIQNVLIGSNGNYSFPSVILNDYLVQSKANVSVYPKALPTYFTNTIFWEEADTIFLNNTVNNANITVQFKPDDVPVGNGGISGFLEEDDGTGRVEKTKRVGGAGVAVRRSQATGKTKTLTLVAYTTTNIDGEFDISGLSPGTYRLNIQYPGYPMDENSSTTFTIGTNPLENDVRVEASVVDQKISVRQLIITGLSEIGRYKASVHPNPATDYIVVDFEKPSANRSLQLFDAGGKTIKQQQAEEVQTQIDVRNLAQGIYLLQVSDENQIKKVIRVAVEKP